MAEDVAALKAIKAGGKEHPLDRTIHDGDTVTLGGATLAAHLTAGHTRGATTWTMPVNEAGKTYQVVFYSSLRSPNVLTPPVIDEFNRSFAVVRKLPRDVPLADHPSEYSMAEKYGKLQPGALHRPRGLSPRSRDGRSDVQSDSRRTTKAGIAALTIPNTYANMTYETTPPLAPPARHPYAAGRHASSGRRSRPEGYPTDHRLGLLLVGRKTCVDRSIRRYGRDSNGFRKS